LVKNQIFLFITGVHCAGNTIINGWGQAFDASEHFVARFLAITEIPIAAESRLWHMKNHIGIFVTRVERTRDTIISRRRGPRGTPERNITGLHTITKIAVVAFDGCTSSTKASGTNITHGAKTSVLA